MSRKALLGTAILGLTALSGLANAASAVDVVSARSTESYTHFYVRGEVVAMAVSGDGDTDLDLRVYTPGGNLVASDTDSTDECRVLFAAPVTGYYTIRVTNVGYMANRFVISISD